MIQRNPTVVAVYKLSPRRNAKRFMKVFRGPHIDKINNTRSRDLPRGAEILDLGIGEGFISKWKKKHKIYSITK
tara:strand:+ start:466 stop:687 length:222 start_codon:yes stop_codon:yes gene_type:complete